MLIPSKPSKLTFHLYKIEGEFSFRVIVKDEEGIRDIAETQDILTLVEVIGDLNDWHSGIQSNPILF